MLVQWQWKLKIYKQLTLRLQPMHGAWRHHQRMLEPPFCRKKLGKGSKKSTKKWYFATFEGEALDAAEERNQEIMQRRQISGYKFNILRTACGRNYLLIRIADAPQKARAMLLQIP